MIIIIIMVKYKTIKYLQSSVFYNLYFFHLYIVYVSLGNILIELGEVSGAVAYLEICKGGGVC